MTGIIFILILLVLVLIHEAGHFFAAKISGVKVDEFAFGFPPKLFSIKKGETNYIFNALPLGGYVKIFGENGDDKDSKNNNRNFSNKNPFIKIFILAAGVVMNFILAYFLISLSVYINKAVPLDNLSPQDYQKYLSENKIGDKSFVIEDISKNSPAEKSGLVVGDEIENIFINKNNKDNSSDFDLKKDNLNQNITSVLSRKINESDTDSLVFTIKNKDGKINDIKVSPVENDSLNKKLIGLSISSFIDVKLSAFDSLKIGFEKTINFTSETLKGFGDLFKNLFTKGQISKDVSGPVGLINAVSQAKSLGIEYIILLAAVLSISLGVFNILPFPALDGGRILFVIIETITKRKISEKWQNILNTAGFVFLILLMIMITIQDIMKLF